MIRPFLLGVAVSAAVLGTFATGLYLWSERSARQAASARAVAMACAPEQTFATCAVMLAGDRWLETDTTYVDPVTRTVKKGALREVSLRVRPERGTPLLPGLGKGLEGVEERYLVFDTDHFSLERVEDLLSKYFSSDSVPAAARGKTRFGGHACSEWRSATQKGTSIYRVCALTEAAGMLVWEGTSPTSLQHSTLWIDVAMDLIAAE